MPVIYSYPKGTSIIDSDSVLGTDQSNKNNTVTYTMVDIKDYVLKDLLDGVQFRLPIYGKPKVLTNSLFYQNTAAETGTAILGDTVYLNNGNNIGNLIVAQNITSSDGNIVSTVGNIAAGGSIAAGQTVADPSYRLKVNGASNFTGAIIADSTITVGGVATFNAAVKANSTVDVVGTLTADGTSNLNGIVRLGGALPSSTSGIFLNRLTYLNSDTTLDSTATLALQGPIKDSSGVLGSNEQVLVSDANGKMSWQFYQSSGLEFQASWNASTDIPDLTSISLIEANVGKYWVVSVAGNTNLSGITGWQIGDWAIVSRDSSDTVFWSKIDNSAAITGTGTNGALTKWTGPTTLGDSIVSESGTTLTIAGNTTTTGDVQIDTLTNNYIPVNNNVGVLRDSGFYQTPDTVPGTAGTISLNTTFADTNYGEVPGLRIASRVPDTPGVIDLFRNDASVTTGESVGILQYSVLDDGRYTVAQIGVETLTTSGVGDSGGGKFIFKTTRGGQIGAIPESRFELDNNSADFSVPVKANSTLDVAGAVRLGFTGNDPVILGNPTGKRTEWNNPGYFEIYAENPDTPGDFNETIDIDGDFLGGGYIGVYPVRTEDKHGVRMHSRDSGGLEANYIDIASVESSAVYDEDQIRLITTAGSSGAYAGIKVSHPTDNRFRFNSEFSTEPTVPFLVNDSAKFIGQVTIPLNPVSATDAASKGYVDSQSGGGGGVSGNGDQYNIAVWSDTTELSGLTASTGLPSSDSLTAGITTQYVGLGAQGPGSVPTQHTIKNYNSVGSNTSTYLFNQSGIFKVSGDNGGRIDVGVNPANISSSALNVGTGVATFKGGVIISNSPGGVQVDNSSLVVGSGTNDNISGSDHCLIVGSGNQITSNSDQSVAFGQGNAITGSIDAFTVGNSNTLTSSSRTQALGFNNTVTATSSFVAGGSNSITASTNIFALGDGHIVTGNTNDAYLLGTGNIITGGTGSFAIGTNLDGDTGNHMVLGYRNNKTSYPATNYSLGLGNTKFALSVGSTTTTNSNALLITEGGVDRGGGTAQVPRIVLPTIVDFNFADDTAALAGGIPLGGLYHNEGALRINLLGSSDPNADPYVPIVGSSFRALGSLASSPFIGLFDSSLALVSPQPSFGALPNSNYTVGAASDSYTYILAAGKNQQNLSPRMSTDSGVTWTSLPSPVSGTYKAEDTTMSKSGQVMVLEPGGTNNYIFLSNDYGSSFTQVTLPVPAGSTIYSKRMVSVSSGGKYIIVSTAFSPGIGSSNTGVFVSQDYGSTFTNITSSLPSPVSTAGYDQVVVSGEGKYQYLLIQNTNESKYSSDYGVSWTNKNYGSSDFRESSASSESGQYVLFPRNTTTALYTDDFGVTTSTVNIGINQLRSSISTSGEFAMFINTLAGGSQSISTNFLSSFSAVAGSMPDGVIVDV